MNLNRNTFGQTMATIDFAAIDIVSPPFPTRYLEDPKDDKVFPDWWECLAQRKRDKESKYEIHKQNQLIVRQRIAEMESENMYLKQQMTVLQMDLTAREEQMRNWEKKCAQNERIAETHLKKFIELNRNYESIKQNLEEKNRELNESKLEKERIKVEIRERLDSERERLKNIFERILAEKQSALEREQCVEKDKLILCKQILDANNTSVDFFHDILSPTLHSTLKPMSGQKDESNRTKNKTSTRTPKQSKKKSKQKLAKTGESVPVISSPEGTTSSNRKGDKTQF